MTDEPISSFLASHGVESVRMGSTVTPVASLGAELQQLASVLGVDIEQYRIHPVKEAAVAVEVYVIEISGKTYGAAFEGSQVPAELDLPRPTFHKRGKGYSARYVNVTRFQALCMMDHLDGCAEGWAGIDADCSADARACARDAERIRKTLGGITLAEALR